MGQADQTDHCDQQKVIITQSEEFRSNRNHTRIQNPNLKTSHTHYEQTKILFSHTMLLFSQMAIAAAAVAADDPVTLCQQQTCEPEQKDTTLFLLMLIFLHTFHYYRESEYMPRLTESGTRII